MSAPTASAPDTLAHTLSTMAASDPLAALVGAVELTERFETLVRERQEDNDWRDEGRNSEIACLGVESSALSELQRRLRSELGVEVRRGVVGARDVRALVTRPARRAEIDGQRVFILGVRLRKRVGPLAKGAHLRLRIDALALAAERKAQRAALRRLLPLRRVTIGELTSARDQFTPGGQLNGMDIRPDR